MNHMTRYFLVGSAVALLVAIGGGMFAYYRLARPPLSNSGLPTELRFVPGTADFIAYADVHALMSSEMHRELERVAEERRGAGSSHPHDFAGVDFARDIDHVVAFMRAEQGEVTPPRGLVMAEGRFDQAKIEQAIRDHGGALEEYHGKRLFYPEKREGRDPDMAMAFLAPDLVAMGGLDLIRRAIDTPPAVTSDSITSNQEMMGLIHDVASGNAWAVGRFEAVQSHLHLPANMTGQVPPVRFISASAHFNGGVKALIKAETADKAAADQLRDLVRGALSLAKLNASANPAFQDVVKSIELGGEGSNVQMSFVVTTDTFRTLVPQKPDTPKTPDTK